MAIKALNVGQVRDYVLKDDKPEPKLRLGLPNEETDEEYQVRVLDHFKPTTWRLKTLDSRLLAELRDRASKLFNELNMQGKIEQGTRVKQRGYYFDVCAFGMEKPDNFVGSDEKDVPFVKVKRDINGTSYEAASDEFLGKIEGDYIAELAEEIISGNYVPGDTGNASASQ